MIDNTSIPRVWELPTKHSHYDEKTNTLMLVLNPDAVINIMQDDEDSDDKR